VSAVSIGAFLGYLSELGVVDPAFVESLEYDYAKITDVIGGLFGSQRRPLFEADIDKFQVADVFGEYNSFAAYRQMGDMIGLDIFQSAEKLCLELFDMFTPDFVLVKE
jgi:hypothetical protein